MTCVALLLDKYKKARSASSDNALALDLGVSRQVVSQWRGGDSYPGEDLIARMAQASGEDAGAWLVRVHAERSKGVAHAAWLSLARQLGVAATLAAAALIAVPSEVYAASNAYYVKWRARLFLVRLRPTYGRPLPA